MKSTIKHNGNYRVPTVLGVFVISCIAFSACNRFVAPLPDAQNANGNWLVAGANPARTSYLELAPAMPLAEISRFKLSAAPAQNLFIHNGILFAPTLDGKLFTVDLEKKRILSKKKMPGGHAGTLALQHDAMILAMRYGKETLFHYNLTQRERLWEIDAGDIASEPLLADSCVYVSAIYEHVDAYHLSDGSRRWQFRTTGQLHASPALAEGTLIAVTDRGKIYALNANEGKLLWEADLGQPILGTPAIAHGQVYVGTTGDLIVAFALQTGAENWRCKTEGRIFHAPAVNDSLVIFGASDGFVRALHRRNGALAWTFRATSGIGTAPLIAGDKVFFGSLDKNIYCVDSSAGAMLWQWNLEGRVRTNPLVWKDRLIVASEDRYLYMFGPQEQAGTN
ncbi:PQQ-like beta-propeller repeat protein [candidate division KSB1 bacterium]|nr:PQQ-like beta-propeller repeat protein [candidate division KSB1 bacterium]